MSDHPMNVPEGEEEYQFAELFIQLPPDWKYKLIDDPKFGWPVHWLRSNAKYAYQNDTWLGGPLALVANDEPPRPIAPNCEFTTLMLVVTPHKLQTTDGKLVRFYQMFPLFTDERQLEIDHGAHVLMNALDNEGVSFVVDMERESVAKDML